MGRAETGISENTPNENEVSINGDLEHPANDDSDSDLDEYVEDRLGQYMPLSQNPNDAEPLDEARDEDNIESDVETSQEIEPNGVAGVTDIQVPKVPEIQTELVGEVWSKPTPKDVDIELTDKKIDLVKQVMTNIQLPSEAIPEWAKNISEDEWKGHLLQRLNRSHT